MGTGLVRWSYGITTVPFRRFDLLPATLNSLKEAGFDKPRLFVDGANSKLAEDYEREFGLEITSHNPAIKTHGNWVLALYELYIRDPVCHRYAVFQDDLVTYKNLRGYLNRCKYPERGYWNLYTFPSNQELVPKNEDGKDIVGWYLSNQMGRGAVGLVFSREAVVALLGSQHMTERPMDVHRGTKAVDGGIVTAMKKAGYTEYVHNPSLVQHTGLISVMDNKPHKLAESFRGENYNAIELLTESISLGK